MAQQIIINSNQIRILHQIGKGYGDSLAFSNVHISSSGGALCDWKTNAAAWNRLTHLYDIGCDDVEISREELVAYLDWFDRREIDQEEFRSQFGNYTPRTEQQQSLFVYLKLAQAFNYPEDIKRE